MENNLIGGQIVKYRKAAGLTQEELGRAVGVSTQAVSRWECGGAPDVTLLPAIADRLGVTIDSLFGREGGEKVNIHDTVRKWIRSLPEEQVFDQLNRLMWTGIFTITGENISNVIQFPESCYQVNIGGKYGDVMNRSIFQTDSGVYFGVGGEDFSFTILCPQPENGYEAYLPDRIRLRTFLTLLAEPGCLEVLEYMLHRKGCYSSADFLAKGTGIESGRLAELLERLGTTGLVSSMEVEILDGPAKVYMVEESNSGALLLFQYLARCMEEPVVLNYMSISFREKPLL